MREEVDQQLTIQNLAETAFKDDAWLATLPTPNLLSKYNVLEYFSRSPFYVPPSLNEEYVIVEEQEPHLYVIQKQVRNVANDAVKTTAVYYILDQTIFQAPTLEGILEARTSRCLYNLKEAFSCAQSVYDPCSAAAASVSSSREKSGERSRRQTPERHAESMAIDRLMDVTLSRNIAKE